MINIEGKRRKCLRYLTSERKRKPQRDRESWKDRERETVKVGKERESDVVSDMSFESCASSTLYSKET